MGGGEREGERGRGWGTEREGGGGGEREGETSKVTLGDGPVELFAKYFDRGLQSR